MTESPPKKIPKRIVELNVGGQVFTTSRETLLHSSSSYFRRILEANDEEGPSLPGAMCDKEGRLFIDRDPKLFELVMEYLRTSHFHPEGLLDRERKNLFHEAQYYDLEGLVEILRPPGTGYDPRFLSDEDQKIRHEAERAREGLLIGDGGGVKAADGLLIDLFPPEKEPVITDLIQAPPTSPDSAFLFDKHVETARELVTFIPPENPQEFKRRLENFGGPLLKNFPMENIVIAGGAVLKCLLSDPPSNEGIIAKSSRADIDIFLVANSPEKGREVFDRIVQHLSSSFRRRETIEHNQLLVVRSPFAITFCVGYPQRHIQLILTRFQCVADVILNFDIDCCQVAWDGDRVVATPSALRALKTGINIADPERSTSGEYEHRLAKYADKGFLVAVPGLEVAKVNDDLIRNCCYGYRDGDMKKVNLTFIEGKDNPTFAVEPEPIRGLSKLIALSTCFRFSFQKNPNVDDHDMMREPPRNMQDGEIRWKGNLRDGSIGTGNYLLHLSKMQPVDGEKQPGVWKKQTPPFPPPAFLLAFDYSFARYVDTVGNEILPWQKAPAEMFQLLNKGESTGMNNWGTGAVTDDTDQKRLVCYDYLPNVRQSTDCPNVLDAKNQFTTYPFLTRPGRLSRFLEFPTSTDRESHPWTPFNQETWTSGVYKS